MSEMSPIIAELERMVEVITQEYHSGVMYNGNPPAPPVVTVATRGRADGVNGWYVPPVWSDSTEDVLTALAGDSTELKIEKRAEFVIATEALAKPEQAVSELARLLLQHWGRAPHVKPGTWYYSKTFKYNARLVDHVASLDPTAPNKGWRQWIPDQDWQTRIASKVNWNVFDLTKGVVQERKKVGSRMRKWTCGCTTVRCATCLDAACDNCGKKFTWAEGLKDLADANFARVSHFAWQNTVEQLLPDGWLLHPYTRAVGCEACQQAKLHATDPDAVMCCNGDGPGTVNPDCAWTATYKP